ncbi:MAG: carboxymuconolactone decarboxylase family protein [Burkholderiaceae bacterium]|nr:carboxymuconolactone decarboxylase family protein [Burkholderiaceae bacterium]
MPKTMQSRLPVPDVAELDEAQKAVYDSILATRGNIDGPFLAWMHSPELASHAEKLGAFCRYQTSLELIESELLILCVAHHHNCLGEQQIHEPIACSAGLGMDIIDQIRKGSMPNLINVRQSVLFQIANQLLASHRLTEETYKEGMQIFGERTLVEIVAVIGYYTFVAITLNAFEMSVPV